MSPVLPTSVHRGKRTAPLHSHRAQKAYPSSQHLWWVPEPKLEELCSQGSGLRLEVPNSTCGQPVVVLSRGLWEHVFCQAAHLPLHAGPTELCSPRVTDQNVSPMGPEAILQPPLQPVGKNFIIKHVSKHHQVPGLLLQIQNVLG